MLNKFVKASILLMLVLTAYAARANPQIAVDMQSGKMLFGNDIFQKWYPASLTKLMTCYVTFRAIKAGKLSLNSQIVMTPQATKQVPAKMYYKVGDTLTVDTALKILMVKSANDIAVALAQRVAGSLPNFVARMNAQARRIGMRSSHFINPNGLPGKGQYTTAYDLAVLTRRIRLEFPQYAHYFSLEAFTTGKKIYTNYNLLIGRFKGADGMKTGYICAAGFNQVSTATRHGRTIITVELGAKSLADRAELSAALLEKAFQTSTKDKKPLRMIPVSNLANRPVNDVSKQICSKSARKERQESSGEDGQVVLHSPFIQTMKRPFKTVFVGLSGHINMKKMKIRKQQIFSSDIPLPLQRPHR